MIFDELGLPKDNGATDLQDSARLAGIMAVFDYPKTPDLTKYCQGYLGNHGDNLYYVRHPKEYKYDMSRDQAVCLVAGFYYQHYKSARYWVKDAAVTGKDILSPSVKGHFRRCRFEKTTWLQDFWLKLDIYWSAYIKPKAEINQLLCMLMVAGPEWVHLFKKHHKSWEDNLLEYWAYSFRQEPELAEHIIKKLREI